MKRTLMLVVLFLASTSVMAKALPMKNWHAKRAAGSSVYWTDPYASAVLAKWEFENTSSTNIYDTLGGYTMQAAGGAAGRFPAVGTNSQGRVNYALQNPAATRFGAQTTSAIPKSGQRYTMTMWVKGTPGAYSGQRFWEFKNPFNSSRGDSVWQSATGDGFAIGVNERCVIKSAPFANTWCLMVQHMDPTLVFSSTYATNYLVTATGIVVNAQFLNCGYFESNSVPFYLGCQTNFLTGIPSMMFDRVTIYTNFFYPTNSLQTLFNQTYPTNNMEAQ